MFRMRALMKTWYWLSTSIKIRTAGWQVGVRGIQCAQSTLFGNFPTTVMTKRVYPVAVAHPGMQAYAACLGMLPLMQSPSSNTDN